MLVLGRKVGEKILIGNEVTITVVSAGRDGVRIGIDAPRSVQIHRAEIVDEVAEGNKHSASLDPAQLAQLLTQAPQPKERRSA